MKRLSWGRVPLSTFLLRNVVACAVLACSDRVPAVKTECTSDSDCPTTTQCIAHVCVAPSAAAAITVTSVNGTSTQVQGGRARVKADGALLIAGTGLDGARAVRLAVRGSTTLYDLIISNASAASLTATLPPEIDAVVTGQLEGTLSVVHPTRGVASADVQILRGESLGITPGSITVRKSICDDFSATPCTDVIKEVAVAYCNTDEMLLSGGCLMPSKNADPGMHALVGAVSAPIARVAVASKSSVINELEHLQGYAGDPMPFATPATLTDSQAAPQGTGWFCEAVTPVNPIGTNLFTTPWSWYVAAYAVCLKVGP